MNPGIDDRLGSTLRALTDIILPALPADASLAREQAQLVIGQLAILRGQLDHAPAFEQKELNDLCELAQQISAAVEGGEQSRQAVEQLGTAVAESNEGEHCRAKADRIRSAVDQVLRAMFKDGSAEFQRLASLSVLDYEGARSPLDRQWFAPMGFDVDYSA